jgi:N-sulfoglucosamine sulfohydrolase
MIQFVVAVLLSGVLLAQVERPNVILVTLDDCGPDFACYGNQLVETPNLDSLAATGQRFTNFFATTPVCSPSRSTLLTGRHAPTIGSHNHRSDVPLPAGVRTIPELLREVGYRSTWLPWQRQQPERFAAGGDVEAGRFAAVAAHDKTDFNFQRGRQGSLFDAWDPAAKGPFFACIDFNSMKTPAMSAHRHAVAVGREVDPAAVDVLPYWPDTAEVREGLARYHEGIMLLDAEIGRMTAWLAAEGLAGRTVIVVWGDHGPAQLRAKQWLYDRGVRVPLLIAGPGIAPSVREGLGSTIDIAPTVLAACGVEVPADLPGRDLLAAGYRAPAHVFATRDRCDETEDRIRSVFDGRYRLIHNVRPELPRLGRNRYTLQYFPAEKALLDSASRSPAQALLVEPRAEFELYDLQQDPLELANLWHAESVAVMQVRERLEAVLRDFEQEVDRGVPVVEPLVRIVPDAARDAVSRQRWCPLDETGLKRVLVIGDSISIGYTPFLREQLAGLAVVHHNPGNGGATTRGLAGLDDWVGDQPWDLIVCNWGLHDLAWRPPGKSGGLDLGGVLSTTIDDYRTNLDQLLQRLLQRGQPVRFVLTTPVPAGSAGRKVEDPGRYNDVARAVCAARGVPVVDLFDWAARRSDLQLRANVHFTKEGSLHLAVAVAEAIRDAFAN